LGVWFVQSLRRKIIAVSFVESWFDAGIWGQIKAIYCSQLAGCVTSPCSSKAEPEAVGLKTAHLCCSQLTMLQNFQLRKRGRKCQLGSGWVGKEYQANRVCLLACLQMHKMLEKTLNWFLSPANQESSLLALISTNDLLFILYILLCNVSGVAHLGRVVNMLYANFATEGEVYTTQVSCIFTYMQHHCVRPYTKIVHSSNT
jgi:hypothetical protein